MPNGIAEAIQNALWSQSERQRREEREKFFSDLQAAGSRERALDVVKNYSSRFQNAQDFSIAFRSVDELYPEPSKEVKQITVFDEETGEATPRFMRSNELGTLENPEEVKRRFGPRATLTKPDLETFYSQPDEEDRVRVLGKLPVSQRPEGAVTLPELTEARRARGEAARAREEARREERDRLSRDRFEKWFGLAEQRWATALGKLGETTSDKELQRGRALLNDATRLTALSLNAKMLPDGSFVFDDDNRAKLFNDRLRFIQETIQADPSVLKRPTGALELHTRTSKALPLTSETPQPEPAAPKPKEPGLVSRLFSSRKAEPKKPDAASQIKAKAAEINSRTDITAEKKKAAIERLRVIAKQHKVNVDF